VTKNINAKKYLALAGGIALLLLTTELCTNYLADPLFFFGGSKISDKSHFLNERIGVIARNRGQWRKFDCVIFGSSHFTYLDASKITGHSCTNLSVSGGTVDEFIAYANYIKAEGAAPRLVIIGTDRYSWPLTLKDMPQFVIERKILPSWFSYYTSLDAFWFSVRTLSGFPKNPDYYDGGFRKHAGTPMRGPGKERPGDIFEVLPGDEKFVDAKIPYYRQLCQIFPTARCMGIAPPVSTWATNKALTQGTEPYLKSMEKLAGVFDAFYDFSILKDVAWNFSETSDGSHFSADVYDHIAQKISNPADEAWGFDVKALPPALYEQRYIEAARNIVAEHKRLNRPNV
jgi:hypothetical protein